MEVGVYILFYGKPFQNSTILAENFFWLENYENNKPALTN